MLWLTLIASLSINARELPVQPDLATARDAVRAAAAAGAWPEGGFIVPVAPGLDYRTQPLRFGAEDSGRPGAPVVNRAQGASLHGGQVLPADSFGPVTDPAARARLPEAARDQVVVADLAALGITDYGQLESFGFGRRPAFSPPEVFIDGQALTLARWPNEGWTHTGEIIDRGSIMGSIVGGEPPLNETDDRGGIFTGPEAERLQRWQTADDMWVFGYWWWDWADQAIPVASVDPVAGTITTAMPHVYGFGPNKRFYAFNLLEELDQPGEMYLDRTDGRLYLWPTAPLATSRVEITLATEPLLIVENASHLAFEGLTLESGRGGGATVSGGEEVELRGCTIRQTGDVALRLSGGRAHRAVACDILDTNGGIHVSGGDMATLTHGEHAVENCRFRNYARLVRTYSGAIHLNGVGLRAVHNQASEAPHSALFFGGVEHLIELNEFFDVCRETSDAGVIYAGRNWASRGNIVRANFIHDIMGIGGLGAFGIYLDDLFSSAEVTDNVLANMANWAFLIGGGRDNVVSNNLTYRTGPMHFDDRGLGWAAASAQPGAVMYNSVTSVPYQEPPWSTRYPQLLTLFDDEPAVPKYNTITHNVFIDTPQPQLAATVVEHGQVEDNWVVEGDPGFVNAAALDLRLTPEAAAKFPGFRPNTVERAGLYIDEWRTTVAPARPVLGGAGGLIVGQGTISLASRTPDVALHYTLDGSVPTAASTRYDGPITVTESGTLRAVAVAADGTLSDETSTRIVVRHLDGDAVYVSELEPAEHMGYGGGLKRDVNQAETAITLRGEPFARGLLMHPGEPEGLASATWDLAPGLRNLHLRALVGVEDNVAERGSVIFIVDLWRDGEWQEAWRSPVQRGGGEPLPVDVALGGAERLRLRVTDGGDNIHADHGAWADARLE